MYSPGLIPFYQTAEPMQCPSDRNSSWSSQQNVYPGLILSGCRYLGSPPSTVNCYVTLETAALLPCRRGIASVENSLTSTWRFFQQAFH